MNHFKSLAKNEDLVPPKVSDSDWKPDTEFLKELHFCFQYHLMFENESVSHSVMPNSATPWTTVHQAPLSMEFSRQEYWSG